MTDSIFFNKWDSGILSLNAGTIRDSQNIPTRDELNRFDFVNVNIPLNYPKVLEEYYKLGFNFITIDFSLKKNPLVNIFDSNSIQIISKIIPPFKIEGFYLEGSRFIIDTRYREFIKKNYWDDSISDHCRDFADFCICITDANNYLTGMISCFEKSETLELFLIIVHPNAQSKKIGSLLMDKAESIAIQKKLQLKTSVVSHNNRAMKFYLEKGFNLDYGSYILHYWKNSNGKN